MASLNRATVIGYLGRDPEVRSFANGGKVCNLRVATTEKWKDKASGETRERTEWHSVAVFADHAVRFAENYLRKGSLVMVEGKLETRKWQDQSGQDRYSTEIAVRPYGGEVMGLDRPDGGARGGQGGGGYDQGPGPGAGSGQGGGAAPRDLDDEIPF